MLHDAGSRLSTEPPIGENADRLLISQSVAEGEVFAQHSIRARTRTNASFSRSARRLSRHRRRISLVAQSPSVRITLLVAFALSSYFAAYLIRSTTRVPLARSVLPTDAERLAWINLLLIAVGQLLGSKLGALLQPLRSISWTPLLVRTGIASMLAPLPLVAYQYVDGRNDFVRSLAVVYVIVNFSALLGSLSVIRILESARRQRVLLLGPWDDHSNLVQVLRRESASHRWCFAPKDADPSILVRHICETKPDRVYIGRGSYTEAQMLRVLENLPATVEAFILPTPWESLTSRLALGPILGDLRLIAVRTPLSDPIAHAQKRIVDCFCAVILLALTLPLIGILAVVVPLSSPGPAFYFQRRRGRHGVEFRIIKFRTMSVDAEAVSGPVLSCANDPRVTRLGRFLRSSRLDELPQLWNVLRGDMSLIGPRPERPELADGFARELPGYSLRDEVRPGITGLAQVHDTYHSNPREKLRFDLAYIYNQSMLLDLRILFRTAAVMVTRKGT